VPSCNRKLGSEKRRTVRPASLRQKLVPLAKMSPLRRGRSADGNPRTYSGEVARLGSASTLTILEVYLLSSCRVVRERSA
jgi:hypothetical protein